MKVHFLGTSDSYTSNRQNVGKLRVCPQERAVWRFDARGGYPVGVEQTRANLGAFRGDLSLFGDGSPSDQNEHSVRWQPSVPNGHTVRRSPSGQNGHTVRRSPSGQNGHTVRRSPSGQNVHSVRARSKRHFVALIGSRPQNEVLIFGTYDRQGSNPQNEVLIFSGSRFPRIKASK